jgi:hypothetical protein
VLEQRQSLLLVLAFADINPSTSNPAGKRFTVPDVRLTEDPRVSRQRRCGRKRRGRRPGVRGTEQHGDKQMLPTYRIRGVRASLKRLPYQTPIGPNTGHHAPSPDNQTPERLRFNATSTRRRMTRIREPDRFDSDVQRLTPSLPQGATEGVQRA